MLFSLLLLLKGNTMATSQLLTDTKKFDEMIVDIITDLRRKHKRTDCESIHKEIVKIVDFSKMSKEDLMNRINILLIDEKILNKGNRNLDSYYVNKNTSPDSNFLETPHNNISFNTSVDNTEPSFPVTLQTSSKTRERSTSVNPIPDFMIGFASPYSQSSSIYKIYEKIKIQNFKDIILQNLCEIFIELVNFEARYEDLVKKSCADYSKIIDHLQDELKSKDHTINKPLTTIRDLTSSELKLKDSITNRTSINQSSMKITSNKTQSINDSDKNSSINAIKERSN